MTILKWAAVAITALMGLMNLGVVLDDFNAAVKTVGVILAVLAVAAILGFLRGATWGRYALVAVGALNVVAGVIGAVNDVDGWPIGLAVAVLGLVLGALVRPGERDLRSAPAGA